ncbi:outer membrane protein assembly factor BamE [Litorimonas sp.]|uniref:outer membrane protein assembly factor BamE n=1 Tax=Litorimonas sp. TaxID=1892381 RepID=UPI003A89C34C
MTSNLIKAACFGALMLSLSACNPILRTHGYVPTEAKPQEVNPETDTKASVLARLGNPSVKSTFDEDLDEDVWFYMNSVRQRYAYLRPKIEDRNITAITFNVDGNVTKVAEYGIEDGQYVDYVNRKTPTRGRELSVLEQIFGTIGRIPTDRLGGGNQDVPGGPGGPGGGR